MEERLHHDFSRVRVHADAEAARAAESIGAAAFTVGTEVAFGAGRYEPATQGGLSLIAHELAHVIQQEGVAGSPLAGMSSSGDWAERRAQQWAAWVVGARHDMPASLLEPGPVKMLMRQEERLPQEPDFAWLATEVYEAMAGIGTDEERVYRALERLRGNPDWIREFRQAYAKYGDLDADIEGDFSGTEKEYVLQLLNEGSRGVPQEVVSGRASTSDLPEMALRVRRAVEGMGTDEEAVFAQLVRLDHHPELIAEFEAVYHRLSDGEDLRWRLEEEMSSSELDHALYLISVPYEYWVRRANEKLRKLGFGVPWGEVCGRDPRSSTYKDAYDVRYWDQVDDPGGCKLVLKTNVSPSAAVESIVEEQELWEVDCAIFVQLAHWYAMLHTEGPTRFNARMGRPFELKKESSSGIRSVVTYQSESPGVPMRPFVVRQGTRVPEEQGKERDPEDVLSSAPVGSRVMWTNPLVRRLIAPEYGREQAYLNENTIKLDKDRFGAFPLRSGSGYAMSRREIVNRMAEATAPALGLTVEDVVPHIFISEIEIVTSA